MAGFSNDVMYANNVDFSGGKSATVTTNGQLLVGSTAAPNIKVGSITSPLGTLSVGYSSPNITLDLASGFPDLHVAKYIVNPVAGQGGNYTTISGALAAASSGETIFVMPGTYTENLTWKAGVNLTAFQCDSGGSFNFSGDTPHVKIVGKITATFAGTATFSGIFFQTNSDFIAQITGTAATMLCFKDCFFNASNNSAFSASSSGGAVLNFENCFGTLATTGINWFALSSGSSMNMYYTQFFNSGNSTTTSTLANGGAVSINYSTLQGPLTTSNTSAFGAVYSFFTGVNTTALTINGTGSSYLYNSRVESGTASAISIGAGATLPILNTSIDSSNTNAITGAGTVNHGNLTFTNTSSNINTTTQGLLKSGPSETFGSANSGNTNTLTITNTSNTASSQALQQITVAGGTAGDAFTTYTVSGVTNWSQGIDNSVTGDPFVIAASSALGTTNIMSAATSGEINYPLQPAFLAYQDSSATNVTGDGTAYTLGTTVDLTEIYDQNADFDPTTGTFTAPVTGRYNFAACVTITGGTAITTMDLRITTSNRSYNTRYSFGAGAACIGTGMCRATDADMDAADTATAVVAGSDTGGKIDDVFGTATDPWTSFSGHLVA